MTATSTVPEEFAPLVGALAAVTDPRFARGKVHPLPGVLALVLLGLMAGCRSLSAISRYGQIHPEVLGPPGLRRRPPVATLHRLLRLVRVAEVRAALLAFTRRLQQLREPGRGVGAVAVAVDGKTLRGVREGGAQLHVLHAFAQTAALALDQVAVGSVREEVPAAPAWPAAVAFPGLAVLTGDALFADQDLCAAAIAGRRDERLRLKKTRRPSSPTRFSSSPPSPARPPPSP